MPPCCNALKPCSAPHDATEGFGEQPSGQPFAATLEPSAGVQPGTLLAGRYKLLEAIGEGGMGTVWVAEQTEPVRRKVAIKLVKPGMDSRQVLARFGAERQALALMDHPNIAKVLDGGLTEQGRPFFAMEYVKGVPLTEYCDQARLSLRERLNLFVPVCQAVQHAHQKGIIHRDLKPSNILICLYDGKPVPKVIDFGLAKALHQSLTEQTLHTAHGLIVGTPLYMSPEQAEHNNLDVDTRTDIYSLGVILYELLTGTTPLQRQQLQEAAFNEMLRLIKEVEPPKPSTRLSGSASLPSIAAQRSVEPNHLRKSLTGDLDWIVMKGAGLLLLPVAHFPVPDRVPEIASNCRWPTESDGGWPRAPSGGTNANRALSWGRRSRLIPRSSSRRCSTGLSCTWTSGSPISRGFVPKCRPREPSRCGALAAIERPFGCGNRCGNSAQRLSARSTPTRSGR